MHGKNSKKIIIRGSKKVENLLAFYEKLYYNTFCSSGRRTNKMINALLAQLVEHLTLNQGVQGSSP